MMKPWTQRPLEEANLLNPAFCCVALTSFAVGYTSIDESGVPFPLVFMSLPIALHKPTRDRLPRDIRTSLAAWVQENAEVKVGFATRVISLKPYTREAIIFGLIQHWLEVRDGGKLRPVVGDTDADRFVRKLNDEAKECVRRARFVGRWFASAGSSQTVMALWGIRP
jgi:hypothetical protein